jgi:hypothetical protein
MTHSEPIHKQTASLSPPCAVAENVIKSPPMVGLPQRSSPVDESTIGCRMRATPYRSER